MKKLILFIFIIISLIILKGCSMNAITREFDFKTPFGEIDVKEKLDSECIEHEEITIEEGKDKKIHEKITIEEVKDAKTKE